MAGSENGQPHALPQALAAAGHEAALARRRQIRERARLYERERHLRRLIALPPDPLPEPARTHAVITGLKRALRLSFRRRARREWSWCPHRHMALLAALCGELCRLRRLQFPSPPLRD